MCLPKSMGGMGFRDLNCFNAALLAKQSWRLLEGSNKLLLDTLRTHYFKHSSIIDACRGHDPSYTWRIWGAKSLLLEGLGWRVGNGCSVRVWEDIWVPEGDRFVVPAGTQVQNSEMLVADLIDHQNTCWNIDALLTYFDTSTVNAIVLLPLSNR